ncbi:MULTISPECIES: S8 family serine peptidase [Kocuria]|uniref:S8 family serine peptidase n=1 Tax=Kocuria TaxID=57493 RepID=UPI0014277C83|nr:MULTISPECIES: S8 family serine peptidase [Kocuria]MCT1734316.1 S8 family serine peptidase [Kocuria marina]QIR70336.1 S8 family serine peptidase [Kocuria sp. KD4]
MPRRSARTLLTLSVSALLLATAAPASAAPPEGPTPEQQAQTKPPTVGGVESLGRGTGAQGKVLAETDRVVVKFKDHVPEAQKEEVLTEVETATEIEDPEIVKTTGNAEQVVESDTMLDKAEQQAVVETLEKDPAVESAEPDLIVVNGLAAHAASAPNDRYWNYQWGPRNIGVPSAWSHGTGNGVVIGIADTGQINHPDLNQRTVRGYDFLSDLYHSRDGNGRDGNPQDEGDWSPGRPNWWHGSHVAGIAAAHTNNRTGIAGVAPDARIQHARVLGADGRGYVSDIADGVMWSAGIAIPGVPRNTTPAKVVNLSEAWDAPTCAPVMQNAVNRMHKIGVPLVVAAGNAGKSANLAAPANCGGAIVVAATSSQNRITGYSNWGPMVDVAAPGGDTNAPIWSTVNTGAFSLGAPSYGDLSGTSMAAPHVSGVIALMKERNPNIGVEAIRKTLRDTGVNVNGYRKVDAVRAARAVAPTTRGAIATYYKSHGGAGVYGNPTTGERDTGVGGVVQHFVKNGRTTKLYWSSRTGVREVRTWTGIGSRHEGLGGARAVGIPFNNEQRTATGGYYQSFVDPRSGKTTKILWSARTGAQPIVESSGIGRVWVRKGYETKAGYPISPEVRTSTGAYQRFQNIKTGERTQYTWTPRGGVKVTRIK